MKPFKIIKEQNIFEGRYDVVKAELETPKGDIVQWEVISGPDIAVVLPVDKKGGVFLKKEWRLNRKDFVWEIVSGVVEEESPTDIQIEGTAQRELQEEVGVKAEKLEKLITFFPFNHMRGRIHIFLARDLVESALERDEHEFLEVKKLPFEDAFNLVVHRQEPTAQNAIAFMLAKEKLESGHKCKE